MQRSDRNVTSENSRVVRVWRDVFIDFLLEEPEVTAAARILSFGELIARDFFRLPGQADSAGPSWGHVDVEEHLVGQTVLQDQLRGSARNTSSGIEFCPLGFGT